MSDILNIISRTRRAHSCKFHSVDEYKSESNEITVSFPLKADSSLMDLELEIDLSIQLKDNLISCNARYFNEENITDYALTKKDIGRVMSAYKEFLSLAIDFSEENNISIPEINFTEIYQH
jgi:hypothetical protein